MKPSSMSARIVVCMVILLVAAAVAHADSINDPTIIVRDPDCPSGGCIVVGQNFTFGTPPSGSGTLFFTNGSGVDWFNLQLIESGVPASAITCITTAFANCTVATVGGVTTIFLSGLGITTNENFSIVFQCNGDSCWPGDLDFVAHANIPEPATLALVFTGLAGIVSRKLRKARS